jgi:hypothetical protein
MVLSLLKRLLTSFVCWTAIEMPSPLVTLLFDWKKLSQCSKCEVRCSAMNIRQLEKRLKRLECTLRCEPDEITDYMFALLWFAAAYYLGNPSRHEKPFAAYARALGYANGPAFDRALEENDQELLRRFAAAEKKLYAKFGHSWTTTDDGQSLGAALTRMRDGLPQSYRDQIARIVSQTKISLDWMRNESKDIAAYIRCFA